MKKFHILSAVFFSFLVFCTKENPTEVSTTSDYSDSITVDMYSYFIWCLQNNSGYYGPVVITPKGQDLLKTPLDPNLKKYNSGSFTYPIFTPKYPPSQFEAYAYDSLPLIDTDSLDPELLVKSYSFSRYYMFRLDSAKVSDSVQNPDKGIKRIEVSYLYGFGFYMDYTKWGLGKIKIYYK
jgi:hypothetical protein